MAIDYRMCEDGSIEEMEISFYIDPARWIHLLGALADSLVDRSRSLIVEERLELSYLIRDLLPGPEQFAELKFTPENMPSPELIAEKDETIERLKNKLTKEKEDHKYMFETQQHALNVLLDLVNKKGIDVPDNITIPVDDGNTNIEDEAKGE